MSKSLRTSSVHINYVTVEFFNKLPEEENQHEHS